MLIRVVRECAVILILGEPRMPPMHRVNYTPVPSLYIILSNNVNELINCTHLAKVRSVKVHYIPGATYATDDVCNLMRLIKHLSWRP